MDQTYSFSEALSLPHQLHSLQPEHMSLLLLSQLCQKKNPAQQPIVEARLCALVPLLSQRPALSCHPHCSNSSCPEYLHNNNERGTAVPSERSLARKRGSGTPRASYSDDWLPGRGEKRRRAAQMQKHCCLQALSATKLSSAQGLEGESCGASTLHSSHPCHNSAGGATSSRTTAESPSASALQELVAESQAEAEVQKRKTVLLEEHLTVMQASLDQARQGLKAAEEQTLLLRHYLQQCVRALRKEKEKQLEEGSGESEVKENGPLCILKETESRCADGTTDPKKDGKCIKCRNGGVSVLLIPCRHLVLCKECGVDSEVCPFCHVEYSAVLHVRERP